jgi:elongation factor P
MKVNEFKRGMYVDIEGELWQVTGSLPVTRGNWRTYYQLTLKNLIKGTVVERRHSGADDLTYAFLEGREVEYLYQEGDNYVFMDTETYEQLTIPGALIKEQIPYVRHNSNVKIQFYNETAVSIDLPAAVVLKVIETDPGARGDTVKNVTKAANMETGLVIRVPSHVVIGDFVKVDTRTGAFIGRATADEIPKEG